VPFITGSTSTTSAGTTTPFTTIERQDVGVTLKVTPHIGEGGTLRLEVSQEVSSIAPTSSIGAATADLVTNKRAVQTTVLADDKQTIVLGGMMQNDNNQSLNSVPGLGSIPYIGALFRSKANSYTKDNLLIFLQPTILRDGSNVDGISQDRYSQIRELQLQLDPNGQFSRLPINANQVYASAVTNMNPALTKALNDDFADRSRKAKTTTALVQPQASIPDPTPIAQP
jgi:general secretion pathway protein D